MVKLWRCLAPGQASFVSARWQWILSLLFPIYYCNRSWWAIHKLIILQEIRTLIFVSLVPCPCKFLKHPRKFLYNTGWMDVTLGRNGLWMALHSTYSWNIKWQKCACIGLNVFQLKWIIGTHCNLKNQNPESRFGATS